MKIDQIVNTEDQSKTLFSELYGEHYHSTFGAKNESQHIFIDAGLAQISKNEVSIFEMGLGTGLNAFLSLKFASENDYKIKYFGIEKHPVNRDLYSKLDYGNGEELDLFMKIHNSDWGVSTKITPNFTLYKEEVDLLDFNHTEKYDLVFFDAFSPDIQPELWSEDVFRTIYQCMNLNGIFMTYSVKGIVKRALKSAGFKIEKIPGPKGKREILRAVKE